MENRTARQKAAMLFIFSVRLCQLVVSIRLTVLAAIFMLTTFIYFIYVVYKLSNFMTISRTIGLIVFEIIIWSVLISTIVYILLKLYNGVIASLPFLDIKKTSLY